MSSRLSEGRSLPFKAVYLALVGGFFLWFLASRRQWLLEAIGRASGTIFAISLAWGFAALVFATLNWRYIQDGVSAQPARTLPWLQWFRVFIFSHLGRYVPGKVTLLIGRYLALQPYGYSKREVVVGALYEYILLAASSTMVGFVALSVGPAVSLFEQHLWVVVFVVGAAGPLLFILSPWFGRTLRFMLRMLRRTDTHITSMPRSRVMTSFLLCSLPTLCNNLCFFFLAASLHPRFLAPDLFLLSLAAVNLAYVASMVLFIFPAGLGLREGITVSVLSTAVTSEQAALLAITYRVLQALTELVFWGAVHLPGRTTRRPK